MATTPKKKSSKTTAKAATPAEKSGSRSRPKAASSRKTTTRKLTASAAPAVTTDVAAVPVDGISETIAVRAYYISEKRRRFGLPGDASQDWLEAESQIRAEQAGS